MGCGLVWTNTWVEMEAVDAGGHVTKERWEKGEINMTLSMSLGIVEWIVKGRQEGGFDSNIEKRRWKSKKEKMSQ